MANKLIAKSKLSLQVEESEQVLPDESDQIVVELKKQLAQLKSQLVRYEELKPPEILPEVNLVKAEASPEALQIQLQIKKDQITSLLEQEKATQHRLKILPYVVDNLQKPIAQMTSDLEHLMESVQDPGVQETLSQCLSVIEGVKHVAESSQQLDSPLHPKRSQIDLLSFFKQIAREKNQENDEQIKLYAHSELPQSLYIDGELFRKSILILLNEISRLSDDEVISIRLRQGEERVYDVSVQQLRISLFGQTEWELPPQAEMEAYLSKTLQTSEEWGLDMLYAKKIVEAHGGSLSFHREEKEVVGFDVTLPMEES